MDLCPRNLYYKLVCLWGVLPVFVCLFVCCFYFCLFYHCTKTKRLSSDRNPNSYQALNWYGTDWSSERRNHSVWLFTPDRTVERLVCWSFLYSAILPSRADFLRSHVIQHEWIAFHSAFFCFSFFNLPPALLAEWSCTASALTRGWNGYRNKSQHRKMTGEFSGHSCRDSTRDLSIRSPAL